MPVVKSAPSSSAAALRTELLAKIRSSEARALEAAPTADEVEDALEAASAEAEQLRARSIAEYRTLADRTQDILLAKLVTSREGCAVFDELCLRIDVNQRYAAVLPQWNDLADVLKVDELRTAWIGACVRPREGLTRAVLEIYMKDGGSLGDVLGALLDLGCLDVLERLRPKVSEFVSLHTSGGVNLVIDDDNAEINAHEKFFSVLKTLALALGDRDHPASARLRSFSAGLKRKQCRSQPPTAAASAVTPALEHSVLVRGGGAGGDGSGESAPIGRGGDGDGGGCALIGGGGDALIRGGGDALDGDPPPDYSVDLPRYRSDLHLDKGRDSAWTDQPLTCRILMIFAADGIEHADRAADIVQGFTHEGVTAEVFRLNESALWYEMLTNPEGCCLKWSNEADYVMPILTPKFLSEAHSGDGGGGGESLLPTSPVVNRYIYTLLRARFVDEGCRNARVRPLLPEPHLRDVAQSPAVKRDPIFRLVWVQLQRDRVEARLRGMLAECKKRRRDAAAPTSG